MTVANTFAVVRLLAMTDREKDAEILVLRHQITVLERWLDGVRVRFAGPDRVLLAALLHGLPRGVLRRMRLLVRPDTVLRWHRNLIAGRRAARSRPKCPGRPPTVRLPGCWYPAAGTASGAGGTRAGAVGGCTARCWCPASRRRLQVEVLLACDFLKTVTLTGARMYMLAVIEPHTRRVRVLGATAHPTASWVRQAARNLVMDLQDAGCRARFLIRDRDGKFPESFDAVLADAGIQTVLTGVRMPRMNAVMERWVRTCRRELLDRTFVWNQRHLLHALREFETFYNQHRPHQGIANARPLKPLPSAIIEPNQIAHLNIRRRQRLGGIINEYEHAA
ncbi:integrase core domain-containing protein [Actinomadura nitritigenes]|uniref:integrase core domain-containing protein n=1 Tax=Actinomadura nitritigenes TaxID=134602 RepID=UPI003D8F60DF